MAVSLRNTNDVSISGVKLLVYGVAGAGKTYLIKTLPDPIILSAEAGLLSILMGGDTDTNCAIAGALVGAYYGFNSFPSDWIQAVENCDTRKGAYPREYYQGAVSDIQGLVYKLSAAAERASRYEASIETQAENVPH